MRLSSLISTVCLVGLLTVWGGGIALAQELDTKWLVGTWKATTPSPLEGRQDLWEMVVKEDGTFKGDIQSARGAWIAIAGSWKLSGRDATFDGVHEGGQAPVRGTRFNFTLSRKGDGLEGTRYAEWSKRTLPISFSRGK